MPRPLALLVADAYPADRLRALQLDFTSPLRRPVNGTVTTDNGSKASVVINGATIPKIQSTPLRLKAGQTGVRLIVGYGPIVALGLRMDPGDQLCIRSLAVTSFRPRLPA